MSTFKNKNSLRTIEAGSYKEKRVRVFLDRVMFQLPLYLKNDKILHCSILIMFKNILTHLLKICNERSKL